MPRSAGNIRARGRKALSAEAIQKAKASWEVAKFQLTHAQKAALEALQTHDILLFSAGNFSGKTMWAVWCAVSCCLGLMPWCPVPADVMLVGLSMAQARGAMERYLKKFIPREMVKHQTQREGLTHITEFHGGSTLTIGTVSQGPEMHQGGRRSVIVYDEEPTYAVYEEGLFRLRDDMESRIIFTMTPTLGRSWVFYELFQKDQERRVAKVEATVFENGTPPCKTCGQDRTTWDSLLRVKGGNRLSEEWMYAQMQATKDGRFSLEELRCGRCWTYGVEPRVSYEKVRDNLARVSDVKRSAMRILGRWEELEGANCFTAEEISALKAWAKEQPVVRREGAMTYWKVPSPDHRYTLGCDAGRGVEKSESVITLLDKHTGQQVVCWGDNALAWTEYWTDIVDLAQQYGNACICVELASAGEGIVPALMQVPGLNLYTYKTPYKKFVKFMGTDVGLPQSVRTRNRVLSNLIRAIRNGLVRGPDGTLRVVFGQQDACYVSDPKTVQQLEVLFYDETTGGLKDGKIDKPENQYDDRVLALSFAWEARHTTGKVWAPETPSPTYTKDQLWRALLRQNARMGSHQWS